MSQHGLDLKRSWRTVLALAACALWAGCGPATGLPLAEEPGLGKFDSGDMKPRDGGSGGPGDGGPADGGSDGGSGACSASWAGDLQEGTELADEGLSVWGDALGNVYVTGYQRGIVRTTNIEPTGDSRAVVTKYGPGGARVWRRFIDTPGTDTAEHVVGRDGRLYVVGRTTGALDGFQNGGQFDLFALELGAEGQLLGALQAGDERPQHPLRAGVDRAGAVLIAGYEDLFVQERQVMDAENAFVGRFILSEPSPEDWRWRSSSAQNPDRITGFALDPTTEHLYVSGFKIFDDGEGLGGAFVRKFGLDGQQDWFTQVGFVATEIEGLVMTPTGRLVAAGTTLLPIGGESLGGGDIFLTELDPVTGVPQWASRAGTREDDAARAMAWGPDGQLYVAGDTLGSLPGYAHQGKRDIFVLEFDTYGQLKRTWQTGTAADEHVAGIWVDRCNNVFLTGYTEASLIGSGSHLGSRDMFLMKVPMPE